MERIFNFVGLDSNRLLINNIAEEFSFCNQKLSEPTSKIMTLDGKIFNAYEKEMTYFDKIVFEEIAGEMLITFKIYQ